MGLAYYQVQNPHDPLLLFPYSMTKLYQGCLLILLNAGSGPLLRDSDVQVVLGSNVLPVFRLLHAEVAAAAAVLARNIRLATGHIPVSLYCTTLHLAESCMSFWGLDANPPAGNVVACTVCCAGGHAAVVVGYACTLRQHLQPGWLSQAMSIAESAPACTAVRAT